MKRFLLKLIQIYKYVFSHFLSTFIGGNCRFEPTCSEYAYESIKKYGILKGCYYSLKRIGKCNPLGSFGYDPVK